MKDLYKTFGIYKITNTINGKTYIGKTGASFGDRWDCHRSQLNGGYHDNGHLQSAWKKYGQDAFEFSVLAEVTDVTLLNDLEKYFIKLYRDQGLCYNILDGGDGGFMLGCHLSEEAKKRIGEKNRANMTGRKLSEETKKKMSESQKKRYSEWTDADRAEYGKRVSEYASGYKWNQESRERFSRLQQTKPNGATLSVDDVHRIRYLSEQENKTYREISDILGIPVHNVYMIATYRRWANA